MISGPKLPALSPRFEVYRYGNALRIRFTFVSETGIPFSKVVLARFDLLVSK